MWEEKIAFVLVVVSVVFSSVIVDLILSTYF